MNTFKATIHSLLATVVPLFALVLGACQEADGDAQAIHMAMQNYLANHGDLCLNKVLWPIDVSQHDRDILTRDAVQMPVLEKLGLIRGSDAQVAPVNADGISQAMVVRRYVLTEAGNRFFLPRPSLTQSAPGKVPTHDFCAAKLRLDHIVSTRFDAPDPASPVTPSARRALVSYTYSIEAAEWAKDPQALRVFPMVAQIIQGAGKLQLQQNFVKGEHGWVPAGLEGAVAQ
jgi:hypothetical protein